MAKHLFLILCLIASIEVKAWKILQRDVCFKGKKNGYGELIVPASGKLDSIRLVYKSGEITCNEMYTPAKFGCNGKYHYTSDKLSVIVTDSNKKLAFPHNVEIFKGFYSLPPYDANSKEVVLPGTLTVEKGDKLLVWYGEDYFDQYEGNNIGTVCVDVYSKLQAKPESDPTEQNPESDPSKEKPESDPSESNPESDPSEPNPESDPSEVKPESDPSESNLESDPSEPNPEADPSEVKPESDPSESNLESDPSEPNPEADLSEVKPESDTSELNPESDPSEAKPESDPSTPNPDSDPSGPNHESNPSKEFPEADPSEAQPESEPTEPTPEPNRLEAKQESDTTGENPAGQTDPQLESDLSDEKSKSLSIINVKWGKFESPTAASLTIIEEKIFFNNATEDVIKEFLFETSLPGNQHTEWEKEGWSSGMSSNFVSRTNLSVVGALDKPVTIPFTAKVNFGDNKESIEHKLKESSKVVIAPGQRIRVSFFLKKVDDARIPFTATISRASTDGKTSSFEEKGTWQGELVVRSGITIEELNSDGTRRGKIKEKPKLNLQRGKRSIFKRLP